MMSWKWPLALGALGAGLWLLVIGSLLRPRQRPLPYENLASRLGYIEPGKREAQEGDL